MVQFPCMILLVGSWHSGSVHGTLAAITTQNAIDRCC